VRGTGVPIGAPVTCTKANQPLGTRIRAARPH
jgi:hypothetical protein